MEKKEIDRLLKEKFRRAVERSTIWEVEWQNNSPKEIRYIKFKLSNFYPERSEKIKVLTISDGENEEFFLRMTE